MRLWTLRAMLVLYAAAISASLVACAGEGSGCGQATNTTCGAGTKRVKVGQNEYKCVANQ